MKRHRLWYPLVTSPFCEVPAVGLGHAVASSGCREATADHGSIGWLREDQVLDPRPEHTEPVACPMIYKDELPTPFSSICVRHNISVSVGIKVGVSQCRRPLFARAPVPRWLQLDWGYNCHSTLHRSCTLEPMDTD